MEAIIKLKRHADEEPIEALILSCKRRKLDSNVENGENLTVLKFAGTVKQQEDIKKHISHLRKEKSNKSVKNYVPEILEKVRNQTKEISLQSRYKIVNCFRALDDLAHSQTSTKSSEKSKSCTILEVENEGKKEESDFVYDLYYTNQTDLKISLENELSIHPFEDVLVVNGEHYSSSEGDSDDSNDENNWRNDYPDSDINEDDMMNAMQGMDLGEGDRELSSDEEEGFIYSVDSEASGFHEDIDESDVMRYGEMYARFKARVKNLEDNVGIDRDLFYDEVDENSENEELHSS